RADPEGGERSGEEARLRARVRGVALRRDLARAGSDADAGEVAARAVDADLEIEPRGIDRASAATLDGRLLDAPRRRAEPDDLEGEGPSRLALRRPDLEVHRPLRAALDGLRGERDLAVARRRGVEARDLARARLAAVDDADAFDPRRGVEAGDA